MNEKEKLQGKRAGFSPEDTGIEAKADRKGDAKAGYTVRRRLQAWTDNCGSKV